MILYENTVTHFLKAAENRTLIRYIIDEYETAMKCRIDPLLKLKWKYMLTILSEIVYFGEDINPDCGIRLDLYNAANHQDVLLILASADDRKSRVLIIDLLPWEEVRMCEDEDMVWYDDGNGLGEQKTVHPSFQLAALDMLRSSGVQDGSIDVKSMSLLYDCEYTRERDITTHYKHELTAGFPVYFINQTDKIAEYVREIVSGGNGAEVLRRIKLIGEISDDAAVMLHPEQKLIFATVKNYLEYDEVAWFIVENPSGTGGSTLLRELRKTADELKKSVVLIDKGEKISPERFPDDQVVVWLYDRLEDSGTVQKIRKTAEEKGVYVHDLKLTEAMGIRDGGSGLNWIERYLKF